VPLGLWKSKVEIYREENDRRHDEWRVEMDRHGAEWREEMDRRDAEWREEMDRRDAEWAKWREEMRDLRLETRDLRADYDREIAETRLFNRELLIRLEKTYGNLNATMEYVGVELGELKAAVTAKTDAIMKLVDRFEDTSGQPPV
jgi:chromosome segregation ATPase